MLTPLTSDLHALKNHLSLRELAEEAGAGFRGSSSRCPLHGGDNLSAFHLYDGDRRWHCFTRCPEGKNDGDLFSFYMYWKNVDFGTALRDLQARDPSSQTALLRRTSGAGILSAVRRFEILKSKATLSGEQQAKDLYPTRARSFVAKCAPQDDKEGGSTPTLPLARMNENWRTPSPAWTHRAQAFIDYAAAQLNHPVSGSRARAYLLSERGLRHTTWDTFQLGYNPETIYDSPSAWGLEGERRIWLPGGIVIPGVRGNQPRSIKVRRPLPGDRLSEYICPSPPYPRLRVSRSRRPPRLSRSPASLPKFGGPRGGHATLFGADLWLQLPVLLLVEGEWDAMLAWQAAGDLVDVATLGGAGRRAHLDDLAALTGYPLVLGVYDADPAGERGREYLQSLPRIENLPPPDHDLTDYWRSGHDLRGWIAAQLQRRLPGLHAALRPQLPEDQRVEWELLERAVAEEAGELDLL